MFRISKKMTMFIVTLVGVLALSSCSSIGESVEKKIDDKVESIKSDLEKSASESEDSSDTTKKSSSDDEDGSSDKTKTTSKSSKSSSSDSSDEDDETSSSDDKNNSEESASEYLGSLDNDCAVLAIQYFSFFAAPYALMGGATQDEIDEFEKESKKLRESVPDEIKDDFDILAVAYEKFANELKSIVKDGELSLSDLTNLEKIEKASEALDTPEVRAAQENVDTYFNNCEGTTEFIDEGE